MAFDLTATLEETCPDSILLTARVKLVRDLRILPLDGTGSLKTEQRRTRTRRRKSGR